jgi:hypothetical protein
MHGRDAKCLQNVIEPGGKRPLGRPCYREKDDFKRELVSSVEQSS